MIIETRNTPDPFSDVFDYFEYPYSEDIRNFFAYLEQAECDVLIFMARKMYRLYMAAIGNRISVLENAPSKRLVIQHNSLPLFADQLKDKRILLCDDMAMSASAIHHHRNLLESQYGVSTESITVAVIFAQEGIRFQDNIRLTYEPIYLPLDRMRLISKSIISFIWSKLTGYVAYAPCYYIKNTCLDRKMKKTKSAWASENITRSFHEGAQISATCCYLKKAFASELFACVRLYRSEENGNTLMIPFVLLPPLSCESMREAYNWCEKTFGLPPMPEGCCSEDLVDAAKYRLITYIASIQLFRRFLQDFDIPFNEPSYQSQDDVYSMPLAAFGLGKHLLFHENWEMMWGLFETSDLPADMENYMETAQHPEGIPLEYITTELRKADTVWSFFGAMSQFDKKTTVFKNGLPETVVRSFVAPSMGKLFYPWLIACMDSAIATMNAVAHNGVVYSYLQKGEQANQTYVDDFRINNGTVVETAGRYELSTAALSQMRRSIEDRDVWQRHLPIMLKICRQFGKENGDCVLDEGRLRQLERTGFEAFPLDTRKKLRKKHKESRYKEIDFFLCLASLYPQYATSCGQGIPSVAGFVRYVQKHYKEGATSTSFIQEVSSYAE